MLVFCCYLYFVLNPRSPPYRSSLRVLHNNKNHQNKTKILTQHEADSRQKSIIRLNLTIFCAFDCLIEPMYMELACKRENRLILIISSASRGVFLREKIFVLLHYCF